MAPSRGLQEQLSSEAGLALPCQFYHNSAKLLQLSSPQYTIVLSDPHPMYGFRAHLSVGSSNELTLLNSPPWV